MFIRISNGYREGILICYNFNLVTNIATRTSINICYPGVTIITDEEFVAQVKNTRNSTKSYHYQIN